LFVTHAWDTFITHRWGHCAPSLADNDLICNIFRRLAKHFLQQHVVIINASPSVRLQRSRMSCYISQWIQGLVFSTLCACHCLVTVALQSQRVQGVTPKALQESHSRTEIPGNPHGLHQRGKSCSLLLCYSVHTQDTCSLLFSASWHLLIPEIISYFYYLSSTP
jgi:hypothetical protein